MRRGVAFLAVLLLGMNILSSCSEKKDISTLSDLVSFFRSGLAGR